MNKINILHFGTAFDENGAIPERNGAVSARAGADFQKAGPYSWASVSPMGSAMTRPAARSRATGDLLSSTRSRPR